MRARDLVIAGLVGLAAAVIRLAYSFFPYINVMDVVVFGAAGFAVARTRPSRRWLSYLLVVLPAMAFIGFVLVAAGATRLREGISSAHLLGAVLVPIAAALGFVVQRRSSEAPDKR